LRRCSVASPHWGGYELVYLFQRPESMARAWAKAQAEMPAGSWLVSLEFAVPQVRPHARIEVAGGAPGRSLWIYRTGGPGAAAQSGRGAADNPV
jgi:hypothetical protein